VSCLAQREREVHQDAIGGRLDALAERRAQDRRRFVGPHRLPAMVQPLQGCVRARDCRLIAIDGLDEHPERLQCRDDVVIVVDGTAGRAVYLGWRSVDCLCMSGEERRGDREPVPFRLLHPRPLLRHGIRPQRALHQLQVQPIDRRLHESLERLEE
jgi:hypothetical protein